MFATAATHAQQLQKGICVQMAVTSTATPMPEADDLDAWIVAITADGRIYFGTDAVTPASLPEKLKRLPRRRDQKLYIKADGRTPFADVRTVLAAAHDLAFDGAVLLTSQTESATPGTVVSPRGLEVKVAPHFNAATIVVQLDSAQPTAFELNDQNTPEASLPDALKQLLQNRSETPVLVKTRGPVSFAAVVHAIDLCHSVGAQVMLSTPQL
jgi:biopolymer transport protein ExbD